jgi:hypothetical protein
LTDGSSGIELRENGSHADYMRHVFQAERIFLWNYFSFTVLHRILAKRPVHYFDQGHMVSSLPALEQSGIDTFYGGWRPPLLRVDEPLDERRLENLAAEACEQFARLKSLIAREMSPRSVISAVRATQGRH